MNRLPITLIFATLIAPVPAAAAEYSQKIEKSFAISPQAGPARLEVDNVNGPIRVVGGPGSTIELVVTETFRADTQEKLDQGRREVKLDISQQGNTVKLYVDGPFRCNCGGPLERNALGRGDDRRGRRSVNFRERAGYKFHHAIELRVPASIALDMRTINEGDIHVENVAGDFDVDNINGSVSLTEVSGSGRAYALNGKLHVLYRSNPKANCYFGSLNGTVDLFFPPGLSADLRYKTFNGRIYTDFPLTPLPAAAPAVIRDGGKFVYKSDRFTGARVGQGGPEIKLDGFNGDIHVRRRDGA